MNTTDTLPRSAGIAACVFAGTAVLAGAFGAHALRDRLGPEAMSIWHTAVEYQFWHALALFGISSLAQSEDRGLRWALRSFVAGILLFSGSLYAIALGAPRLIGLLTPVGGLAFVAGWVCLARFFVRSQTR
ncbi:MAG: DUF423 domain-containing protein [Dokdonella sp.]